MRRYKIYHYLLIALIALSVIAGCKKREANTCQDPNASNYLSEPQGDGTTCEYNTQVVFYTTTGYYNGMYFLPARIYMDGVPLDTIFDSTLVIANNCGPGLPSSTYAVDSLKDGAEHHWVVLTIAPTVTFSGTIRASAVQNCLSVKIH